MNFPCFQKRQQLKIAFSVSFFSFLCTFLLSLHDEMYVPCKLDSAYSSPFMAFTWLLLKRANPNSWEKAEQEMALHGEDIWKTTLS